MSVLYNRVVLANPPSAMSRNFSDGCWSPRGLWSVASAVRRSLPEVDIRIIDGNLLGYDQMESEVLAAKPDLVGVAVHTTFAYPNALRLMRRLQEEGINIVLGGFHATCLPKEIVQTRRVDVIVGAGEEAFVAYLSEPRESVPGLYWLKGGTMRNNPLGRQPSPWEGVLDFSVIDRNPYVERFRARAPRYLQGHSGYLFFTHQGCHWRDTSPRGPNHRGGCSFCCLPMRYFCPDPKIIWQEVERVLDAWEAPVYFKDYGDCFSGSWAYAQAFLDARPPHIKPHRDYLLEVYLKPGEVRREEEMTLLRRLGVHRAFVGFESANGRVLRAMHKGSTPKFHRECAELVLGAGLELNASFILGCETEDKESVADTVRFAESLANIGGLQLACAGASPLAVMPGSPVFEKLLEVEPSFVGLDDPPVREMRLAWIKHFCGDDLAADPEEGLAHLEEAAAYITALAPIENYVGWLPSESVRKQARERVHSDHSHAAASS